MKTKTPLEITELKDAIRYLTVAADRLSAAGEPMLAARVRNLTREADLRG